VDLIIRNARLADGQLSEPLDIGVAGGKIVAIESGLAGAAETYDAAGRLACAGVIEKHIHLDKSARNRARDQPGAAGRGLEARLHGSGCPPRFCTFAREAGFFGQRSRINLAHRRSIFRRAGAARRNKAGKCNQKN